MTDRRTELEFTLTEALKRQQLRDERPLPDFRLLFPLAVVMLACMLIGMFVPEDARVLAWAFWVAEVAIVIAFVGVCIAPFVRRYLPDRRIKVLTEELIHVQASDGGDADRR